MPLALSKKEQVAIAELQKLAKAWPESLWLFSGSGTLCVMKKTPDGARAITTEFGGVDQQFCVANIAIENDGGDW